MVIGDLASMRRRESDLPLDVATVRAPADELDRLRRRADAWLHLEKRGREEQPEWSDEVAWRLARLYEQRFAREEAIVVRDRRWRSTSERLREQVRDLLLAAESGVDTEKVWNEIDRVRRVALPSILESLRHGFERDPNARKGSALSDGLPEDALSNRHVLLSTQHRMHPEMRQFIRGPRQRPYLSIELCTVDRFQGHEADLVIITFAWDRAVTGGAR